MDEVNSGEGGGADSEERKIKSSMNVGSRAEAYPPDMLNLSS